MNVTIKYTGSVLLEAAIDEMRSNACSIAPVFAPTGGYTNTPVFTEGYPVDAADAAKKYGKSVYATNVYGWGQLPGLPPMANTTIPFAQFERAVLSAAEAKKAGKANTGIEFTVDGYKEEIYWHQMSAAMVDQGFYIKLGDKEYGVDVPAASEAEGTSTES